MLGLGLAQVAEKKHIPLPSEIQTLIEARRLAREAKDWTEADRLREMLHEHGFDLKDTASGQEITPLGL